jgi:hypothetical protein
MQHVHERWSKNGRMCKEKEMEKSKHVEVTER